MATFAPISPLFPDPSTAVGAAGLPVMDGLSLQLLTRHHGLERAFDALMDTAQRLPHALHLVEDRCRADGPRAVVEDLYELSTVAERGVLQRLAAFSGYYARCCRSSEKFPHDEVAQVIHDFRAIGGTSLLTLRYVLWDMASSLVDATHRAEARQRVSALRG